MSVDMEAHLLEDRAGYLLSLLRILESGSLSLGELICWLGIPFTDLFLDLIHLIEQDWVMEDVHLLLITVIEWL